MTPENPAAAEENTRRQAFLRAGTDHVPARMFFDRRKEFARPPEFSAFFQQAGSHIFRGFDNTTPVQHEGQEVLIL